MKRSREQPSLAEPGKVEPAAFSCELVPSGSGFRLSVQLPGELIAGSPVLSGMAELGGNAAASKQPECLFAWLAWHASRSRHADAGAALPSAPVWDGEVDAFNVRHTVTHLGVGICLGVFRARLAHSTDMLENEVPEGPGEDLCLHSSKDGKPFHAGGALFAM